MKKAKDELIPYLNKQLSEYKYNKYDNQINNKCVYKILDIKKLPGEKFKEYNNYLRSKYEFRKFALSKEMEHIDIQVSNLGRIKINGEIAKQYQKKYGYLVVKINGKIIYDVYRLVAETFVDCPVEDTLLYNGNNCWTVHHITNNGFDNRIENLIWLSWNDHLEIKHNASQTLKNIKNKITEELGLALVNGKNEEEVLDMLEDFILLKKNDSDELLIDKICTQYNIGFDEFCNERYI